MQRSEFYAELEKYPKVRGDDYYNVPSAFNKKTSFPLAPTSEIELAQENLLRNQFQSHVPRQNLDKFVSSVIQNEKDIINKLSLDELEELIKYLQ